MLDRLHRAVGGWRGEAAPMDDETVLVVSREAAAQSGGTFSEAGSTIGRLEALEVLRAARERGACLRLPASLDSLVAIREWLDRSGALQGLSSSGADLLDLALYEVCANVVEHGYGQDPSKTLELWWVSNPPGPRGHFLVRDQGRPFRPERSRESDFDDRSVRLRGRGFGLDIIYRTMSAVAYFPDAESGNITLLGWDPSGVERPEEAPRA